MIREYYKNFNKNVIIPLLKMKGSGTFKVKFYWKSLYFVCFGIPNNLVNKSGNKKSDNV